MRFFTFLMIGTSLSLGLSATEEQKTYTWYAYLDLNLTAAYLGDNSASYSDFSRSKGGIYKQDLSDEPIRLGLLHNLIKQDYLEYGGELKGNHFRFNDTRDCEEVKSEKNVHISCAKGLYTGSSGFNLFLGYNFHIASSTDLLSNMSDYYFLRFGLVYSKLFIGDEAGKILNYPDSSSEMLGIYFGINAGFRDSIFHSKRPFYVLVSIEIRFVPIKFPGTNVLIQEWQFAIPLRFALNLY